MVYLVMQAAREITTTKESEMTTKAKWKPVELEAATLREREWIKNHGGDLCGYIVHYGMVDGEGIYAADLALLARLEAQR